MIAISCVLIKGPTFSNPIPQGICPLTTRIETLHVMIISQAYDTIDNILMSLSIPLKGVLSRYHQIYTLAIHIIENPCI